MWPAWGRFGEFLGSLRNYEEEVLEYEQQQLDKWKTDSFAKTII